MSSTLYKTQVLRQVYVTTSDIPANAILFGQVLMHVGYCLEEPVAVGVESQSHFLSGVGVYGESVPDSGRRAWCYAIPAAQTCTENAKTLMKDLSAKMSVSRSSHRVGSVSSVERMAPSP